MAKITGSSRNDRLSGTNDADELEGFAGNDVLIGMAGDDRLTGGDGQDRLFGGNHQDVLDGGSGADFLDGGAGADWLVGGADADVFTFSFGLRPVRDADGTVRRDFTGDGADVIADFSRAQGDRLQVSGISVADIDKFRKSEVDVNGDGQLDTIITLTTDASWSLTLLNHTGFDASLDVEITWRTEDPPAFPSELIEGTSEADVLGGASNTEIITGHGGMDIVAGGAGDDVIVGGNGSDLLSGGDGADRFVLKFGPRLVKAGQSEFLAWRTEQGLPALTETTLTHRELAGQYGNWLKHVMRTFAVGTDLEGDGVVSLLAQLHTFAGTPLIEGLNAAQLASMFGNRQSVSVLSGDAMRERFFSNSFTMGEDRQLYSGNGRDRIVDFDPAEGDRLVVSGITEDTLPLFRMRLADVDADGRLDTVISLQSDPVWSLTLLGVSDFRPAEHVIWA